MRKLVFAVALLVSSATLAGAPTPSDKLTSSEVHELRYLQLRGAELQHLIDAYNAETVDINARIRKAHAMGDKDSASAETGMVVRAPKDKK